MKVEINSKEHKLFESVISDLQGIQIKLNNYSSLYDEQGIETENTLYFNALDTLLHELIKNITTDKLPNVCCVPH